ncbi:hypothetical protein Acy02nite_15820 [Actinoplanes cyaneus]|uniref:DUF11 domain-containing protein n=1 Tax=Actinoplanes cyaneus TaxID=52696 RepID=A0A919IG31_9ACTN|nr:DUF11 domain-containing protein [Actinoplanes cyaneus]MCW2142143.1 conserved repeat domain-containing protein [Actinoplanes cyaneus]GID63701.1 hypothetical protein Acy02nite_15820 [Actinoplanes cyaneus]
MADRRRRALSALLLFTALLVVLPRAQRPARAAPSVCPAAIALTNGDFEAPVIGAGTVKIMSQTLIPGWLTTATDRMIELWRGYGGVPEQSGSQHAELNANQVSTLYQDLATTPGEVLRWQLSHRGRTGTDTMALQIGKPAGPLVQQGATMVDGKTAWGTYSGIYAVPAGQSTTRFAFKSVASASTDPSIGNFLDAISFGTGACLTTSTTVVNRSGAAGANVGDTLTVTVTARNDGGNPAGLVELSDVLPPGATYVPGSLRSINGATSTAVSDAAADDTGEYDAAGRTVRVRAGTGATTGAGGSLQIGESRSLSYQVKVPVALAGSQLDDDATATFHEPLSATTVTSTSNVAGITVDPAADLVTSTALTSGSLVAGQSGTWTVTGLNRGPGAATAAGLDATMPAGLTGLSVTGPGGACSITGQVVECDYPSIASGASRTMTITGNVPATAGSGTPYPVAAAAQSGTFELNQADNLATTSASVVTRADLDVDLTYSPANPFAGTVVTYTATVTNNGPSLSRGVVLTDPLPSDFTGVSWSGACVPGSSGTLECALPDLAPGASRTVMITATLPAGGTGAVNNGVAVSSATPDPVIGDNNASVSSPGGAEADVQVSLVLGTPAANAGDTVPYTLTVRNDGPSVAHNVVVSTVAPPGATIERPTSGPYVSACTATACSLGDLQPGVPVTIAENLTVDDDAHADAVHTSATVVSPTTDLVPANNTSTASLTISLNSDVAVTGQITNPDSPGQHPVAGERIRDVVTVTNAARTPGNHYTRAEGLVVHQPVPAGQPVPVATPSDGGCAFDGTIGLDGTTPDGGSVVCVLPVLATGATWRIDFDGRIPAAFAATSTRRDVTVTTHSPDADAADNSDTVTAQVEHHSDFVVAQSTSTASVVETDPVAFRATVRNTGPSDAAHVLVQVQAPGGLAIGQGVTATGVYDTATGHWQIPDLPAGQTVSIDLAGVAQHAGTAVNVVRVVSSTSTDPDTANNSGQATVVIGAESVSLRLVLRATLSATGQNTARTGDTITYQADVTNSGNVPMSQISVSDALTGTYTCPRTTLATGATMTCDATGQHRVTQADLDAGHAVSNSVSAVALAQGATVPATYGPALVETPVEPAAPAMTVTSTATVAPAGHQGTARAGDSVTFRYTIANTGNVTMSAIAVTDSLAGAGVCPGTSLAGGTSMVCTGGGAYVVTQADVDAGTPVAAAAAVTARAPGAGAATTYANVSATIVVEPAAEALTAIVTETVTPPSRQGAARAGDTIAHRYAITNTGNVTMSGVAVADTLTGVATCPGTTLAPGASMSCASGTPYTVTQSDADAGAPVSGSVVVSGRKPGAAGSTAYATSSASTALARGVPALNVTATATVNPVPHQNLLALGDVITYRYLVTNTGTVTMSGIGVTGTLSGTATCPGSSLAPGTTMTCAGGTTYTVDQDDVDAGVHLADTASVSGRAPGAGSAVPYDTAVADIAVAVPAASLSVTINPAVTPPSHQYAAEAGDTVAFQYVVVNNGNVTMTGISVTGTHGGTVTCPAGPLHVGQSITCTESAGHVVTQGDVDSQASFVTSATVHGQGPGHTGPQAYGPRTASISVAPAAPMIGVAGSAVVSPAGHQNAAAAGDTVAYSYVLTNRGNVTLGSITVADALGGAPVCTATTLAVHASTTCRAVTPYRVTQADVDAGQPITGSATVTAAGPGGGLVHTYGPEPVAVTPVPAAPALALTGTAAVTPVEGQNTARAGDMVTYELRIANTGNVTMSGIAPAGATCPAARLAPAGAMLCTVPPVTVTDSDVDAGRPLQFTALVTARPPGAAPVMTFGPVTVVVPVAARVGQLSVGISSELVARGTLRIAAAAEPRAGDRIRYHYQVTNTGNVPMDHVSVYDQLIGTTTCAATALALGGSTRCTANAVYQVTQTDIDSGLPIRNLASASAVESGTTVPRTSGPVWLEVPVEPAAPAIAGTQVADWVDQDGDGVLSSGDPIISSVTVTNTGNVTLTGLVVTGLPGAVTCPKTTLAPGESVLCTSAAYHLTAAEIAAGRHTEDALISADTTNGDTEVDGDAPATVVVPAPSPTATPSPSRPGPTPSRTRPGTPAPARPTSSSPPAVTSPAVTSPPAPQMPVTGSNSAATFVAGFTLIAGGSLLLAATIHRRRAFRVRRTRP